jgi:DNA invertase Pin-like site-specific DNA recombinase
MPDHLREGEKSDRRSRSLKDLLVILERIYAGGAGFRSLTESIDTTTLPGRMMMHTLGSFAEFERQMIRPRTKIGLDEVARVRSATAIEPVARGERILRHRSEGVCDLAS